MKVVKFEKHDDEVRAVIFETEKDSLRPLVVNDICVGSFSDVIDYTFHTYGEIGIIPPDAHELKEPQFGDALSQAEVAEALYSAEPWAK